MDIRIENGKIVAYDESGIGTIFLEPGQKISRKELGNKRIYTNGHIQDPVMNGNCKTLNYKNVQSVEKQVKKDLDIDIIQNVVEWKNIAKTIFLIIHTVKYKNIL